MIGGPPFPVRPAQLTAAFLSEALGTEVTGFRPVPLGEGRGMLGTLVLLDLHHDDGAAPARLVAKFSRDRPEILDAARRNRTHERELRFHDELGPRTRCRTPAMHGAWYDPDTAEFLLLQEYVDGDESIDQLTGLTVDQARSVLTDLADLHAGWWRSPETATLDWLPGVDNRPRRESLSLLAGIGWPNLARMLGDLPPAQSAFGANLVIHLDRMLRDLDDLPATLVHADPRVDNIVFDRATGQPVLVDWQGVSTGPPALDVAYFVTQSLPIDLRRRHETTLLDHYRARFNRAVDGDGGGRPTADPLAGYDQALVYGLVVATAMTIIGDPGEPRSAELARTMAERALVALTDHGMVTP